MQYLTVHGYRRAFRRAGSGPTLLFIHGIGDSSRTWRKVLASLAAHFTVLASYLLGHGDSDKPPADYSAAAYAGCETSSNFSTSIARPSSATRWAAARRCSSHTSFRNAVNGSCW